MIEHPDTPDVRRQAGAMSPAARTAAAVLLAMAVAAGAAAKGTRPAAVVEPPAGQQRAARPDPDRTVIETLGPTRRAVVAEGDFEPRSLGSYSIRLYELADPRFPYDRFVAGRVMPREGTLEAVRWERVDGDALPDLVVIIRSVGTGGFLYSDAFTERDGKLERIAAVRELPKDADVLRALRSPEAALRSAESSPARKAAGR